MYDPELYRERAEVDLWKQRDPIAALVRDAGVDDAVLATIDAEVTAVVDDAVAFAEAGHPEPVEDLLRFVTTEETP
jgi:pyruvate dehydrogenase E1 component alpha subunit